MSDRDPRYTGGRIWGAVALVAAVLVLAVVALTAALVITGAIQ